MSFKDNEVEKILQAWALYDSEKTGMMKCDDFIVFLHLMDEPFGVEKYKKLVKAKDIVNQYIYNEEQKVVITIKDLLDTAKRFQMPIYEVNSQYYVHFVDYISYITNKANSNYRIWPG